MSAKSYAGNGWTLASGGGLRSESMAWNLSTLTQTNTVQGTSGAVAFQKTTTYAQYAAPLGQAVVQEVVDPSGAALTTQWFYYTNSGTDGTNYGQLKMVVQPSGYWQSYMYDSNQLVTNITSQFLNCATNSATNLCRVDSYAYTNINGSLYAQTAVEALLGQEVSRTYYLTFPSQAQVIRCQSAGAAWNAANNLVTTINYVPNGPFAGQPLNQLNPDGTLITYQYATNGTTSLKGSVLEK